MDSANLSAAGLVNLLTENFSCFRDETIFHGRRVRLYKRAQILVADLWACFNGEDFGEFHDIDKITMFAGTLQQPREIRTSLTYNPRLSYSADAPPAELHTLCPQIRVSHPRPEAH